MIKITKLKIGKTEYTENAQVKIAIPIKYGDLLDEQLDELNITLKLSKEEHFKPLPPVELEITEVCPAKLNWEMVKDILSASDYDWTIDETTKSATAPGFKVSLNGTTLTEVLKKDYIIASDNSLEIPLGGGRFTHELYLIELTKYFEGFIGDTLTFTNPLGNNYKRSLNHATAQEVVTQNDYIVDRIVLPSRDNEVISNKSLTSSFFATTYFSEKGVVTLPSYSVLHFYESYALSDVAYEKFPGNWEEMSNEEPFKTLYANNNIKRVKVYDKNGNELAATEAANGINFTVVDNVTEYTAKYRYVKYQNNTSGEPYEQLELYLTYNFTVDGAPLDKKKLTITDVINRICDTIEPKTEGQTNRFSLNKAQAAEFDKILAPEFSFTQNTMREMLQQIGGFIHAEPRLTANNEIVFDKYGSGRKSKISARKLISAKLSSDINNWCSSLNSNAENLVNQLDYAGGVSVNPVSGGYITLRSEATTLRMGQDDGSFIPTDLPIYKLGEQSRVICTYIPNLGEGEWDITPYIFEKADYDSILSSYSEVYPFAKTYALYYTQGEKNIKGLFFKVDSAISPALKEYAITNILRAVTGKTITLLGNDFFNIGFNITYTPVYSTRIRTVKQTAVGAIPRTINYNQGANMIETRYYGENLKGVVARLGNIEKTLTFYLAHLTEIPKVGYLYDDNYYISAVSCEILPTYIKCTVGLSKDFNRLSQYVGISSNKRMWEVSEKQSVKRQSIFTEYLKISLTSSPSDTCAMRGTIFKSLLTNVATNYRISACIFNTRSKSNKSIGKVLLPAVPSALGTSMVFTSNFADNYSAGAQAKYISEQSISGYWANFVSYCDYYGEAWYLSALFISDLKLLHEYSFDITDAGNLPEYDKTVSGTSYALPVSIDKWVYRKDNREVPQISYELAAVTDDEDFIIGSALMQNCAFVTNNRSKIYVYGFSERLDKLNSKIDLTKGVKIGTISYIGTSPCEVTLPDSQVDYPAWAIATEATTKDLPVVDDDGNEITQTITIGGEIVIGANKKYSECKTFYLSLKKSIEE